LIKKGAKTLEKRSYKPISDYAAIGNLRSVALIGIDGSIDWCCLPHMDSPSVFAALLDYRKGGRFRISAAGQNSGEQFYVEDSNVLATRFRTETGTLTVFDLMPIYGNIKGCEGSEAPPEIHRIIECEGGDAEIEIEWSPRFDYARSITRIEKIYGGWLASGGNDRMTICGIAEAEISDGEFGPVLRANLRISGGTKKVLITRWGADNLSYDLNDSLEAMDRTVRIWHEWAHKEEVTHSDVWAKEWLPSLIRSELVLKMMSHADTGAIAAAPTTSLPETIGGVRNWDYRYAWIRDSSMTAQALISMGHETEAIELLEWMERVSASGSGDGLNLQIMYGIHGGSELDEQELSHLEGYRGSRPVNIGNGAAKQFQLEIYGELLSTAYELARRGRKLDSHIVEFLRKVVDHVESVWEKPDYGIWEVRGEARHFTYSKVMAWVALDRAIHLSEQFGFPGDVDQWKRTRSEIRRKILEHGYNREIGSFVLAFDSDELDAANLRIPLLEFLPFDDPRVQGTINRTLGNLTENGLVYRYRFDDGLPGEEGAFGLCTFWLVDALALSGRLDEARSIFENAIRHANHVGLFAEQFDARTGEFLGNFPQAFTHIGLINSALYIAYAEGRDIPEHAPIGTPEHRSKVGR
jgi:GH15 family glucan-1,4-alpha-glucosidase